MSNATEYTLTQDQLQVHGQIAVDELIRQAHVDEVIDTETAEKLSDYVLVIQTNRGFTDRLRKLLGLIACNKEDRSFQTCWLAIRADEYKGSKDDESKAS